MAAKVNFLDRVLDMYGPEAAESGELLRQLTEALIQQLWPGKNLHEAQTDVVLLPLRAFYRAIEDLAPQDDEQRSLKAQALEAAGDFSKTRWLLSAKGDTSIAKPMLATVIVWLATIFVSFGLFAPMNKTAVVGMFIAALSVSSAICLIMELDQPFEGLIQISSAPLRNTLSHRGASPNNVKGRKKR